MQGSAAWRAAEAVSGTRAARQSSEGGQRRFKTAARSRRDPRRGRLRGPVPLPTEAVLLPPCRLPQSILALLALVLLVTLQQLLSYVTTTRGTGSITGFAGPDQLDAAVEGRIHHYWWELRWICPNRTYRPRQEYPPEQRTSVAHVRVEAVAPFRGLGHWHRLRMITANATGQRKEAGGDLWVATLQDHSAQQKLPVRVFDDGDGTYSLVFVALAPGNYSLSLRLYYTQCAGWVGVECQRRLIGFTAGQGRAVQAAGHEGVKHAEHVLPE